MMQVRTADTSSRVLAGTILWVQMAIPHDRQFKLPSTLPKAKVLLRGYTFFIGSLCL